MSKFLTVVFVERRTPSAQRLERRIPSAQRLMHLDE
jgi:hypothetical protein